MDKSYYSSISYSYSVAKNVIAKTDDGKYKLVDTTLSSSDMFSTTSVFSEMPDNKDFILSQYDILAGEYPTDYTDIVLVVDGNNYIDTALLDAFGIEEADSFTPEALIGRSFRIVLNDDYYEEYGNKFVPNGDYEALYESGNAIEISVCGILRMKEDVSGEILATGMNYTTELTDKLLFENAGSEIVKAQRDNQNINVLTGGEFDNTITYENIMQLLGGDKTPVSIQIYPKNFESKDNIKTYLESYNDNKDEEDKIVYTDLSESMSDSITSMVDTIEVILIAFAGISLIVSTVMIGIITYVSVVERTKEIGIMRAIGARKKDISRIFNAETIIIGLASGLLGVLLDIILCIPASSIISSVVGLDFVVSLPGIYAVMLVLISVLLTLIAGFFPSKLAAGKDPVIALRTE